MTSKLLTGFDAPCLHTMYAELGNLLREDVLFVGGTGHPCIGETDGEGGVGVGGMLDQLKLSVEGLGIRFSPSMR